MFWQCLIMLGCICYLSHMCSTCLYYTSLDLMTRESITLSRRQT